MTEKKTTGRPKGTTGKARAITDDELLIILESVRNHHHSERNHALIIVSHYLGLRAKELASLKVKDVWDGKELHDTLSLIAAYTKGGKHRDLTLGNPKVREALQNYLSYRKSSDRRKMTLESPLFRTQQYTAFSPTTMVIVFEGIYEKAGIKNASSHSGRRSLIMRLDNNGVPINLIRQIAGHKDIKTTLVYINDNYSKQAEILAGI